MNAGRWTGLQRRVRVPSPDEKQGARADGGDDTRAEGGRDLQVTVIERGLARRSRQEVGPPDRKLWVRRAR